MNLFGGLPEGRSNVVLDTNHIHYKQCRLMGSHGSSSNDNRLALELIVRGRVNVATLISERIGLDGVEDALIMNEKTRRRLKTVVMF